MIKIGHFIGTGADLNLELGFIPDFFEFFEMAGTNANVYRWFHPQESNEASGQQEGVIVTGSSGIHTYSADDQGISEYDDSGVYVNIESPQDSGKKVKCAVTDWAAATNYSSGQRSASACGTIVRPPIHNGRVFELTTDTSTGVSEPASWDVQPGETVTDGGGNVWTCRKEEIVKGGGKGVTIRAEINSDSVNHYYIAFKSDTQVLDHGNADDFLS